MAGSQYTADLWKIATFEKLETWQLKLSPILSDAVCLHTVVKSQRSSARFTQCHSRKLPESASERRKQFSSLS